MANGPQPANPADPNDPAYDWTRVDQVLIGLDQANITPIVSTYSTPTFAVDGRNTKFPSQYNPNAPIPQAYGLFMKAVATRYSGFFTTNIGGVPTKLPRVRHSRSGTRPTSRTSSASTTPATSASTRASKQAYRSIKEAQPNAVVIAGVGGPRSSGGNGNVSAKVWMNKLVSDKSVKFDAYSQHIYPSQAPKFTSEAYAKVFPTWDSLDLILDTLDKK